MICVLCNEAGHTCSSCDFSEQEFFQVYTLSVCWNCYPKECQELFDKFNKDKEALEEQLHEKCKAIIEVLPR